MMKILSVIVVCLILLTGGVFAQKTKKTVTKFSSVYTNLNKDCKTLGGGDGQDEAFDCRGAGSYRIDITPSAAVLFIAARTPDKKDSIPLASQDMGFDQTKIKLEWRTANGKPFAVIMRVAKYGEPDDENPYLGKKIGEQLIVKGLKGFENIDFAVDAKTPDANAKARELADKAYSDKPAN